jgi:hypothetical protein
MIVHFTYKDAHGGRTERNWPGTDISSIGNLWMPRDKVIGQLQQTILLLSYS